MLFEVLFRDLSGRRVLCKVCCPIALQGGAVQGGAGTQDLGAVWGAVQVLFGTQDPSNMLFEVLSRCCAKWTREFMV